MAAPTAASYRHFLGLTSTKSVLPASAVMTPSVDYTSRSVTNNAPIPVGRSKQREYSMFSMAGAVDGGDLALALANWLPWRYTALDADATTDDKAGLIFIWQDSAKATGFQDPKTYDRILSWSPDQPVLEADQPTLESVKLEFRRQGDLMLTSSWFAQEQKAVSPRPAAPIPNPAPKPQFVEGGDWSVKISRDGVTFAAVPGVLRATVDIPKFREPVFRGGDADSWGEVTDSIQSEPMITLALLSDQAYITSYFTQGDTPYYIEIDSPDMRMRFQTEFANKTPWGTEGNALMADIQFNVVGQYVNGASSWAGAFVPAAPTAWPRDLYGYFEVYGSIHTVFS